MPKPGEKQRARAIRNGFTGEEGTTLLQYACVKLIGPPAFRTGTVGDWYWNCPFHPDDRPSFHTLPKVPEHPEYWKCFGCGRGGDIWQLIREFREIGHPLARGSYEVEHKLLVAKWEAEHIGATTPPVSSSPLTPLTEQPYPAWVVWQGLTDEERQAVLLAEKVYRCHGVDPVALALCGMGYGAWRKGESRR
jgi:hypothetical protein